jgi:hypothetical protein
MTAAAKSPLTSVIRQGDECLGFLMKRGPAGVEGYTADERSVGASDRARSELR